MSWKRGINNTGRPMPPYRAMPRFDAGPGAAFFWRGGGGLRHLGRSLVCGDDVAGGPATDARLSEPACQLQRTVVCRDDHGRFIHEADPATGKTVSPVFCPTGRRQPGSVVAGHSHPRTAAGLAHQRTGGDDHLRPAAEPAILRIETRAALRLCHARIAVHQHLGRWRADALRGAAGVDGGRAVGLEHAVHVPPFRLDCAAGHRHHQRRLLWFSETNWHS